MNNTEKNKNVLANLYQHFVLNYFDQANEKQKKNNFDSASNTTIDKSTPIKCSDEKQKQDNKVLKFDCNTTSNNEKEEEKESSIFYLSLDYTTISSVNSINNELDSGETCSSRKILISERLLKTKRIWYLPNLDERLIYERLRNKPFGNFILTGSFDIDTSSISTSPNKSNLEKQMPTDSNQNNRINNLILYLSNENNRITEHSIELDENYYFYFKNYSSAKFKSILALLEYYITEEKSKSARFKLTLPKAISEASNLQQLNSLSLLEQDFWLNEFYYKYSSPCFAKQASLDEKLIAKRPKRSNRYGNRFHTLDLKSETIKLDFLVDTSKSPKQKNKNEELSQQNKIIQSKSLNNLTKQANSSSSSSSSSTKLKPSPTQLPANLYDPRFNSHSNFNYCITDTCITANTTRTNILNKSNFFSRFNKFFTRPKKSANKKSTNLFTDFVNTLLNSSTSGNTLTIDKQTSKSPEFIEKEKYKLCSNDSLMFDLDQNNNLLTEIKSNSKEEIESYDNATYQCKQDSIISGHNSSLSQLSGAILDQAKLNRQEAFDLEDNLSINSCLAFIDNRLAKKIDNNNKMPKNLLEIYSSVPTKSINLSSSLTLNANSEYLKNPCNSTVNLIVASSSSNEYSEPFDVITEPSQKSKTKSNESISFKKSNLIKTSFSIDDDSAYSSCYQNQSELSNLKIVFKPNEHSNDTEEETMTTFDSSVLLSSSSCSSSPLLSLLSGPRLASNTQQVNSEYEHVKDATNEVDLYKSTITAFDILSERCSELIDLFEESTNSSTLAKSRTVADLRRKHFKHSKSQDLNSKSQYLNSNFLDRTLTFDSFIKSSALLSWSHENSLNTSNQFNSIRNLIYKMAKNEKTIFGKNISEFIKCTQVSKEQNPCILMSNTRQFMNGIKNYLLKNENIELRNLIDKERAYLEPKQILNIDCLIEDCLQSILLQPLKCKIYHLIVDWFISDGSIIAINKNIKFINSIQNETECLFYLGFNSNEHKPNSDVLKQLRVYYKRMQCEYAPLIKLKYILFIINDLLSSIKDFEANFELVEINDLLPVVIYALSKCQMYAIQIEIEYIWSLVNRSLLSSETVYYLTMMSSACYALVNLNSNLHAGRLSFVDILFDVYFPDERGQVLKMSTVPVRPMSKCKDVVALIASKIRIYNSDEYALYLYENEKLTRLKDDERPFEIRFEKFKLGAFVKFIYKQKMSNILWSKSIENF